MKKYCIALIVCFFSFVSHAMDMKEGDYVPGNKIKGFVERDPLNAFTYQLLRHSHEALEENPNHQGRKKLHTNVTNIWCEFKKAETSEEVKQEMLKMLLDGSSMYLTPNHRETAINLGLIEKTIWDRSTLKFGPTVTSLLKGVTFVAIVSTFVVCPVAAAVAGGLQGSFRGSCAIIQEERFPSSDRNIQGNYIRLEARCRYDREAHGSKINTVVVPESGPCGYLHNNNGTLIASDNYRSFPQAASTFENQICPTLGGSFSLTCGKVTSEPYSSSDSRIPEGSVCQYTVPKCIKRGGAGTIDNELYIPKSEVKCQGSRIENCDGRLVVRKAGQSDRQCDDKYKSEL